MFKTILNLLDAYKVSRSPMFLDSYRDDLDSFSFTLFKKPYNELNRVQVTRLFMYIRKQERSN